MTFPDAKEINSARWLDHSHRADEVLRKGIEDFYQNMDKEMSGDFIMNLIEMALRIEVQRQGFKSIDKITELTGEMWQDKFAKFPKSLLASIKKADAAIPRERLGDLLRQALRVGATEQQVDDAFEQPEPRQALLALIKSKRVWSAACVKGVVTTLSEATEEVEHLKAKATELVQDKKMEALPLRASGLQCRAPMRQEHNSQIAWPQETSPSSKSGLQSKVAMWQELYNQTARPQCGSGLSQPRSSQVALESVVKPWEVIGSCIDHDIAIKLSHPPEQVAPKRILIIGSSGDGKSTIVNNLKSDAEDGARVSMEVKGTTKNIKEYRGRNNTIIMDTPGVGDYDISVLKLYALLEEALSQKNRRIDYVVVTTPLNTVRFHLALQIVQFLVRKGFHKDDGHEWSHIIFCGTKKDRAEPEELESFQLLADAFYEEAPHKTGCCVMVDQNDISELEKAISTTPGKELAFQAVGENELAIELSAKLGFEDNDEFLVVLRKEREALKAKQNECQG